VETDAEGAVYKAHMTKSDGSQVTVKFGPKRLKIPLNIKGILVFNEINCGLERIYKSMKLWFTIIITLLFQEIITTNAVLLNAYQQNVSMWLVFGVFILATTLIISAGFGLGKFIQKRFGSSKIVTYSEKKVKKLESVLGPKGTRFGLVFLGLVNFNHINGFLASWLSIPFKEALFYLFIGDLTWYILEMAIIFGVSTFIDPTYAVYVVLGISLAVSVVLGIAHNKMTRRYNMA
jgi:membrane protein YqaA with SNARE-associated domain